VHKIEKKSDNEVDNSIPKEKKKGSKNDSSGITHTQAILMSSFIGIVSGLALTALLGYYMTGSATFGISVDDYFNDWIPRPTPKIHGDYPYKKYAREELAKFDGSNPTLPILMSVKGKVYDVTAGKNYYGPGGGYHGFAGRDATRALLDLCFTDECLARGWEDVTEAEKKSLDDWVTFYDNEAKYPLVGELILPKKMSNPKNKDSKE